jgi:hypothetical protein
MTTEVKKILNNTIKQLRDINAAEMSKTQPNQQTIKENRQAINAIYRQIVKSELKKIA